MKKLTRPELAKWLIDFMRHEHLSATQRRLLDAIYEILRDTLSRDDYPVSVIIGQIKIRGDVGLTGELGEEEEFVRMGPAIFPVERMCTGPPVLESQLQINEEKLL